MKVVIAGGTGQIGSVLRRAFLQRGDEVVVLSRKGGEGAVEWDGRTLGPWAGALDGADVVINLAGRSVNCRYTKENLDLMLSSRVDSARVIGEAIERAANPPRVWLQMSTATIYAHTYGPPNDERSGALGGTEPFVPRYWDWSVRIAREWERAQALASTPRTRKVALRAAMVMSPDRGGVFSVLSKLARFGLGGALAGGAQFVSWIHEADFVRAIFWLMEGDIEGPVNLSAPGPLPQRDFMRVLRGAWGMPVGLHATKWMLEVGAFFLRTDTELLLKSRRVVPGRLLDAGFEFDYPTWSSAAEDLVARTRWSRRMSGPSEAATAAARESAFPQTSPASPRDSTSSSMIEQYSGPVRET